MQKGNKNNKSFIHGVNEALIESMKKDKKILCYGLGVTDPKGIFGSTKGLEDRFGSDRIFDMPTSENAMTGVAIGAALGGYKVVMTHQRLDFFYWPWISWSIVQQSGFICLEEKLQFL